MTISIKKIKKILLRIFLILQLTISLIFLMQCITMKIIQKDVETATKNTLKSENVFKLMIEPEVLREKEITKEGIDNFYNYIQENDSIKASTVQQTQFKLKEDTKVNFQHKVTETNPNGSDMVYNYFDNPAIFVDENYLDVFNIKISEGEQLNFQNIDFENNVIPVLAGETYKQEYKINDLIETNEKTFKIIGFLEKGQKIILSSTALFFSDVFIDDFIIIPKKYEHYEEVCTKIQFVQDCIIKVNNNKDEENIRYNLQKNMQKNMKENNIEGNANHYLDLKSEYLDSLGIPKPHEMIVYITIVVCSIAGICVMLIFNIIYRKNEIGIKLALGYSKVKILGSLTIESAVIVFISYLMTILYYEIFNIEIRYVLEISLKNSSILFYICVLLLIIINIVPIVFLMKKSPKELIGGLK